MNYGISSKETICELLKSEKKKGGGDEESLFKEMMTENFPNLQRDLDIQVHEAHRSPDKINLKSSS